MKTQKTNKMGLKKLTIAKINIDIMNMVNGGSSAPTLTGEGELGYCRATSPDHGKPCIQIY